MNYPAFAGDAAVPQVRRTSLAVIGALTIVALGALAARISTEPVHGILPLVMGFVIVTELISSYLFFSLLVRSRIPAAVFAACAYLLSAGFSFPYLAFFPNVFGRGVPLGASVQASFELWIAWHAAFPLALMGYAVALRYGARTVSRPAVLAAGAVAACAAVVAIASVVCVSGVIHAPLLDGDRFTVLSRAAVMPALCALDLCAIAVLWACTRLRSPLHVWLAVALYASLLDVVLGILSPRYSSGWYAGKFLALASSATIVALFLHVFARMYDDAVRAQGELARARERDAESRAHQEEQQARLFAQAGSLARVGSWEVDPRSGTVRWSDELYEMFALPRGSVINPETYVARIHPDDRSNALHLFDPAYEGDRRRFTHRLIAGDGSVRTIEGRAESIAGANGRVERWFGTIADQTERAEIERRLTDALQYDGMTGLRNRTAFRDHLIAMLAQGRRETMAVLVVDVDRLKVVNDAVGHVGGDVYLHGVAQKLAEAVGDAFIARGSGDEFLVLLERCGDRDDASVFARRLLKAASSTTMVFGREFALSVSIGVAMYPADGVTADELIRCADIAMYEAKDAGRNGARFFSSTMRDEQVDRAVLEGEIRTALRMQSFHLEYQPIVGARDGGIFGAEALLRWLHPTRGPVSPTVIVDIAERAGLMGRLGAWILNDGIRQRARWSYPDFTLALNVSAGQLQHQDFTLLLGRMLASSGVAPAAIELELTESAAMEGALVEDQMRACLALGVHFALDDFGTHYSSISYLQRLAIDRIKIDRSFVRELPDNARDAAIVRALIELAHSLGRTVIAEGVEDARQLAWLRDAGCDYVQGYAIARPMIVPAFDRWLETHGNGKVSRLHARSRVAE